MAFDKFPRHLPKYKGLTRELLESRLEYEPKTGKLIWRKKDDDTREGRIWNTSYAGKQAGAIYARGYVRINLTTSIGCHRYLAHVLVWILMTGALPEHFLDHRNEIKSDNRWGNIREATKAQNGQNRGPSKNCTSGFRGVHFFKRKGRYAARVTLNGKHFNLGYFDTAEEANEVRIKKAKELYGEFFKC